MWYYNPIANIIDRELNDGNIELEIVKENIQPSYSRYVDNLNTWCITHYSEKCDIQKSRQKKLEILDI